MKATAFLSHCLGRAIVRLLAALVFGQNAAQALDYTNIASGNWNDAVKWSNGVTGVSGADTVIVFKPAATDNSTNNNPGAFWLNQLLVAIVGHYF